MRTFAFKSANCPLSLAARSLAGNEMSYSRLSPSLSVSVTCIFVPPYGHRGRQPRVADTCRSTDRQLGACVVAKEMVRAEGLEPPRLSPPEPKSGTSTSSATPAASAGLTRPICFRRSISACPPCAIKKYPPDAPVGFGARQGGSRGGRDPPRAECGLRRRRARLRRLARTENALTPRKSRRNLGIWRAYAWTDPFRRKPLVSIFGAARNAPKWDKW